MKRERFALAGGRLLTRIHLPMLLDRSLGMAQGAMIQPVCGVGAVSQGWRTQGRVL